MKNDTFILVLVALLCIAAISGWMMYGLNPRIVTIDNPVPAPAPAAPDSVIEMSFDEFERMARGQKAADQLIKELQRYREAAESRPAELVLTTEAAKADTAVGLKMYRSVKTFTHPTMHFGLIESHIEATAPLPVRSFTNTVRFLEGEDQVYTRVGMECLKAHPCPPGHFWTGFGYGGMTGFALALTAVLLVGGVR